MTLVVGCTDFKIDFKCGSNQVFHYTAMANMLNLNKEAQRQNIQYFINLKRCSKIIFIGHVNCNAINYFLGKTSPGKYLRAYKVYFEGLLRKNHMKLVQKAVYGQILLETNIITQCEMLLNVDFIRAKVKTGKLKVIGCLINDSPSERGMLLQRENVIHEDNEHRMRKIKTYHAANKVIFYNGLTFNDLVGQN